ncbi:hypothetical protein TURU_021417 [Turdus rufiventris]|nr:hypothetical protein TURU_021417 [Turdus rufiventris]
MALPGQQAGLGPSCGRVGREPGLTDEPDGCLLQGLLWALQDPSLMLSKKVELRQESSDLLELCHTVAMEVTMAGVVASPASLGGGAKVLRVYGVIWVGRDLKDQLIPSPAILSTSPSQGIRGAQFLIGVVRLIHQSRDGVSPEYIDFLERFEWCITNAMEPLF